MRVALIADPHGNAPALRSVLADAHEQKAEACWCLGDVFGRGPLPVTCMKLLLSAQTPAFVRGNHDEATFRFWNGATRTDYDLYGLTPDLSDLAIGAWHAAQLRESFDDDIVTQWKTWPTWTPAHPGICAAHGAILSRDQQSVENISGERSYLQPGRSFGAGTTREIACALQQPAEIATWLVVVGHSHWQSWAHYDSAQPLQQNWVWHEDFSDDSVNQGPVLLDPTGHEFVILCPGAVGQPRNAYRDVLMTRRDLRAQYALLDTEQRLAWFRRVDYDVRETLAAMVPFPKEFASDDIERALREQREALQHTNP